MKKFLETKNNRPQVAEMNNDSKFKIWIVYRHFKNIWILSTFLGSSQNNIHAIVAKWEISELSQKPEEAIIICFS